MEVVYFPEELHARAPSAVGVLCFAPANEWGTLFNVVDLVRAGETVTIRPASEQELQRAESRVVLHEIGLQLAEQVGAVLDNAAPEVVAEECALLSEHLRAYHLPLPDLIQPDAPVEADVGQADSFNALLELYEALHCAYIAGDQATLTSVNSDIQAILMGGTAEAASAAIDCASAGVSVE